MATRRCAKGLLPTSLGTGGGDDGLRGGGPGPSHGVHRRRVNDAALRGTSVAGGSSVAAPQVGNINVQRWGPTAPL